MSIAHTFCFQVLHQASKSRGRLGRLLTPHGSLETPAFIFCATKASVKGVMPCNLVDEQTQIILANTYHLMLQPGADRVAALGGLHKMMGWQGPMLTDSGGFQIFSLGYGSVAAEIKGTRGQQRPKTLLQITEEGALFKSYTDGALHMLTPEKSIQIQQALGADLIVVLDECTPYHVDKAYTEKSMLLSHRWAKRSLAAYQSLETDVQALYGIVQGGIYEDLRRESAAFVSGSDFFGHAVGGCLGASKTQMDDVIAFTLPLLNPRRPIHLLGIGGIRDIFAAVRQGVDTLDCVHPTRLARHGGALVPWAVRAAEGEAVSREHINLRNHRYAGDTRPIDENCPCHTCQHFSRGYIHHLLKAKEMLALTLLSLHNVRVMNTLLAQIRQGLQDDSLENVEKFWLGA